MTAALVRAGVPPQLAGALQRYRVMSWVTGTALLLLCLAMVLTYLFNTAKWSIPVVAPIHGYLFIVYLLTVVHLGMIKQRWPLTRLVLVGLAGTIPVMSFVFERKITRLIEQEAKSAAG